MLIKKILFDDFEKIAELNHRNNLTTLQRTDWENLWKKNPYFLINNDWTIGWKLVDEDKIVGICLNIPFLFELNKKQILAAVCNNYVIDKKYRTYSLKLRHLFLNQKNIELFITNSANKNVEKIMEAFKAKKINQFDYQNRLLFISNKTRVFYNYLIKLIFNKKKFKKNNLPDNIKGSFQKNNLVFIIKESFDDDFSKLEKKLNKSELRSSKKLEWLQYKYNKYSRNKDLIIIKIFKDNEFVGYFLIVKVIEKNYNLKKLSIAEIIVLNDDQQILNETIKFCKDLTKKYNFDLIDVIGYKKNIRLVLKKQGFFAKKSKNFNFLVKNLNSNLNKDLFSSKENLNLSLTDGDSIFYLDQ